MLLNQFLKLAISLFLLDTLLQYSYLSKQKFLLNITIKASNVKSREPYTLRFRSIILQKIIATPVLTAVATIPGPTIAYSSDKADDMFPTLLDFYVQFLLVEI